MHDPKDASILGEQTGIICEPGRLMQIAAKAEGTPKARKKAI